MERRDRASDMRNLRIWDGKHIESKLKQIVPKLMEENEIKDAVERVEKGVKKVSDETMVDGQRTLRGVVRVGPAAKGTPRGISFYRVSIDLRNALYKTALLISV